MISRFLAEVGVARKSHPVPDRGPETKRSELEEIQSRCCFNQRLDSFFLLWVWRGYFAGGTKLQTAGGRRRAPMMIQGRSQPSPEQRQKERAARRVPPARDPPITALTQSAAGAKDSKRHTWRKRQSVVYLNDSTTFSLRLCQLSRIAFFLSFVSLPGLPPLIRPLLFGFCCTAKSLADLSLSPWVASLSFPWRSPPSSPEVSRL